MKNSLILTNLSNLKNVDDDVVKLFIARVPFANMAKYGVYHCTQIAPSSDLLSSTKAGKTSWESYVRRYRREIAVSNDAQSMVDRIYKRLDFEKIALVCYCGDHHCHALILGHYFEELGVNVVDGVVNRK